jgi:hypothetical protein
MNSSWYIHLVVCEFIEWWELININVSVSRYITVKTRVTERVLLVEQDMLTLPVHMCSPRILVAFLLLSLNFSVLCFIIQCLSFFFSFGHCIVCFWLPLWYLQAFFRYSTSRYMVVLWGVYGPTLWLLLSDVDIMDTSRKWLPRNGS